jgi:hypothetical protein
MKLRDALRNYKQLAEMDVVGVVKATVFGVLAGLWILAILSVLYSESSKFQRLINPRSVTA